MSLLVHPFDFNNFIAVFILFLISAFTGFLIGYLFFFLLHYFFYN